MVFSKGGIKTCIILNELSVIIRFSVFSLIDGLLEISGVEHGEALEDVLDLLPRLAVQTSLVGRGVELRPTALLAPPGLVADMQVHKLNVDVHLKQDGAEHDQVHLLFASRDVAVFTDQDAVPNGVFDHVVRIDNFQVLLHSLRSLSELASIRFVFVLITLGL